MTHSNDSCTQRKPKRAHTTQLIRDQLKARSFYVTYIYCEQWFYVTYYAQYPSGWNADGLRGGHTAGARWGRSLPPSAPFVVWLLGCRPELLLSEVLRAGRTFGEGHAQGIALLVK